LKGTLSIYSAYHSKTQQFVKIDDGQERRFAVRWEFSWALGGKKVNNCVIDGPGECTIVPSSRRHANQIKISNRKKEPDRHLPMMIV
jgi:hypothetical protein